MKLGQKRPLKGGKICYYLTKDINEFNKVYLSLISMLFIFFCGLISFAVTNSFAWFTFIETSNENINVTVCVDSFIPSASRNDANEPVLSENMIPVYYDECAKTWKKADITNEHYIYRWYNYDKKIWANSITVKSEKRDAYKNAGLGTEIDLNDVLTVQVWIPRYKYKVWNYNLEGTINSVEQEIEITFENEKKATGEIKCSDSLSRASGSPSEICKISNTNCTNELCNGKTYTHPAFTFGEQELTGFWTSKFELSINQTCTPASNSAVGSGCNLNNVTTYAIPSVPSWRGAMVGTYDHVIRKMNDNDNIYGFTDNDDIHMIKNREWGALAYLSHSKYGKNSMIEVNRNSEYKTGCGPVSLGSTTSGACNKYETELGQSASTTGNIYGVYDMSGGSYEYTMANMVLPTDLTKKFTGFESPANYSGFSGTLAAGSTITGSYEYPDEKYYDRYSYVGYKTTIKNSKLGDAIREISKNASINKTWYDSDLYTIGESYPWSKRGGYQSMAQAGIFTSDHSGGASRANYTTRFIISIE